MAGTDVVNASIVAAGLPAVAVASRTMPDYFTHDRAGRTLSWPDDPEEWKVFVGRGFGRLAADSMDSLIALADAWRPDVVVSGQLAFAGALLAHRLGVPWVRHAWDTGEPPEADLGAAEELREELAAIGSRSIPEPAIYIDVCPPSLRPIDARPAQSLRYVGSSPQRRLEPWMYMRGERRRVCVTAGCRVSKDQYFDYLRELTQKVAALDVEVIIAAPDEVAADVTKGVSGAHAGWLPLDVVARTCDLFVHHAGGGTSALAMSNGLPQLLIPNMPSSVDPSIRLAAYGAALMLMPGEDTVTRVVESAQELLDNPRYRGRAAELQREISVLPTAGEVLHAVEALVT